MFKPLKNLTVVTLAVNIPGPLAAKRLYELGATVIKVEPPEGDPLETYSADWYKDINVGQQRKIINLKSSEGKKLLATFLSKADLLLTAQRPSALQRLGLNWGNLHNWYPSLNHVAIVGYPVPDENEAGHDLTYQAAIGLLSAPIMPKTLIADMAGAERAVTISMALLMGRKANQAGRMELVALSDSANYMAQPYKYGLTKKGAFLSGAVPQYAMYETKSDWIALAALEPHFSEKLKKELGLESLSKAALVEKFKQQSADAWVTWAKDKDIPIVAVKN